MRSDIYPDHADVGSAEEIIEGLKKDFETIGRTIGTSVGNRPTLQISRTLH